MRGQLEGGVNGPLGAIQIIRAQPDPGQIDIGLHVGRVRGQGPIQVQFGGFHVKVGQVHQGQGDQSCGGPGV
jgi:hypothetical protein